MIDFDRPFAVLSADRPSLTVEELEQRREQLRWIAEQNGYTVTECVGVWKGETETSFVIHGEPNKTGWELAGLTSMMAGAYCQDAYIIYDGLTARLMGGDTKEVIELLGSACPANEDEDRTVLPNGEAFKFKRG